ncbi:hypothetical protein M407DRAFT_210466 [Tulasnella calospora MUT 4182]|uniref:Uncharacterized protein n=1 Tax=Tulasnella calospora MUT 4182 TaxID=1051891 RepID=A0A0C3LGD1_9AGAM|nr:hypothetical protein M407DRAFT_210466 [Tulasnella calospora MUT 4182]
MSDTPPSRLSNEQLGADGITITRRGCSSWRRSFTGVCLPSPSLGHRRKRSGYLPRWPFFDRPARLLSGGDEPSVEPNPFAAPDPSAIPTPNPDVAPPVAFPTQDFENGAPAPGTSSLLGPDYTLLPGSDLGEDSVVHKSQHLEGSRESIGPCSGNDDECSPVHTVSIFTIVHDSLEHL